MLMLQLHTIASGAFVLPALQVIDLSHNAMVEVRSGCLIVRLPNCYKGLFIYYVISDGGVLPDLLQYYMGWGGSADTPKLYYVIYEQPLKQVGWGTCKYKRWNNL